MPTKLTSAIAIFSAVAISALAGCSSAVSGRKAAGPPPVPSIPVITTAADRSLPIEAYMMTSVQQHDFTNAQNVLKTACMKRYGFDFRPYVVSDSPLAGLGQTTNRYGPVDPAAAAEYGYHHGDLPVIPTASAGPTMSDAMLSVLGSGGGPSVGPPTPDTYNGIAVPKGGCSGEVADKLGFAGKDLGQHGVVSAINFDAYTRSLTDERLTTAFAGWAACMKARGFSYPSPNDVIDDKRWQTQEPSAVETATASADVACKRQANVVGTWFAVESAYEQQMIEQHGPELAEIKQNIGDALRKAAAVSSGSGG